MSGPGSHLVSHIQQWSSPHLNIYDYHINILQVCFPACQSTWWWNDIMWWEWDISLRILCLCHGLVCLLSSLLVISYFLLFIIGIWKLMEKKLHHLTSKFLTEIQWICYFSLAMLVLKPKKRMKEIDKLRLALCSALLCSSWSESCSGFCTVHPPPTTTHHPH